MRNNKFLFNLYQIYKYIIFFPFLAISICVLIVFIFIFFYIASERFVQIAGIGWTRFNSFITPMFVTVIGKNNINKNQSYVIVANHQSLYDIFALYGWLPVDFRWVMKIELRHVPVLGYYCYKAGHIYIDRSDHQKAVDSINAAKRKIKDGTCIVFFPEGTRSMTGDLIEFKKGAFKFALDINLPILPVTIVGTRNILPAGTIALFPGRARLILHKPIEVGGYTEDNIKDLMSLVRQSIQKGLDEYATPDA
jgi:1-acyl-sn-glycerol-3-phosphate acyltransferase